ncbi:SufD family Fe-S cluster assembly protein [Candidatus Roizmanbacteria bacterium]|nr:SufD family Fe-S cluster assembly protein [Candidatus Roizmanbacteria bacterium]
MRPVTFIHIKKESGKGIVFEKPGKYVVFFHNLSGELAFDIREQGVELEIYGLYTGHKKDSFKVKTVQHHRVPNSQSNLLIKGVFDDDSAFLYEGMIRIEKSAQGTHAYQKNQNLLLSPYVFVSSKPDLEILANDVYCTHGSTTGKLSKQELFYIQARGVDKKRAEFMMVGGFIENMFSKISDSGVQEIEPYKYSILKPYA